MADINEFLAYAEKLGVRKESLLVREEENAATVMFSERIGEELTLLVSLIYHKNMNTVEIYVQKDCNNENELAVFQKLNQKNLEYTGLTFLVIGDTVCVKTAAEEPENLQDILGKMLLAVAIASEELQTL